MALRSVAARLRLYSLKSLGGTAGPSWKVCQLLMLKQDTWTIAYGAAIAHHVWHNNFVPELKEQGNLIPPSHGEIGPAVYEH